jgi:hypothetical protein
MHAFLTLHLYYNYLSGVSSRVDLGGTKKEKNSKSSNLNKNDTKLKSSSRPFQRRKRHLKQSPHDKGMASQSCGQPSQSQTTDINIRTCDVSSELQRGDFNKLTWHHPGADTWHTDLVLSVAT